MADKALRGNRLTEQRRMKRSAPKEEMDPTESLGVTVTGGWKGKPHSTKEGRIASGERKLTRFFYGRKKEKPKGTKV